jgi:hypothetical protein
VKCSELVAALRADPLVGWSCDEADGFLRIRTPFRYSDGGIVELYAEQRQTGVLLTDLGEAFRFLQTYGLDPLRSALRRTIVDLAVELGGAQTSEGAIEILVPDGTRALEALVRLGQIVTRVADLALLARGSLAATFPDAVEEFLTANLRFSEVQRNGTIRGSAALHQLDFVVRSRQRLTGIAALSAVTGNGANAQTAFTIQKFADIASVGPGAPQRITVIEDSGDVWSESLRKQLQNFSEVVDWERRDDLLQLIGDDANR